MKKLLVASITVSTLIAGPAFAAGPERGFRDGQRGERRMERSDRFDRGEHRDTPERANRFLGVISNVSGTTFTLTDASSTAFTVQAANARIMGKSSTSTLEVLSNGSSAMVFGELATSTKNITASRVMVMPTRENAPLVGHMIDQPPKKPTLLQRIKRFFSRHK